MPHTQVQVEEADGRIYITFRGPEQRRLGSALRAAFRGHHELYRTSTGRYRLWHRDRERLERFVERWCDPGSITWSGR